MQGPQGRGKCRFGASAHESAAEGASTPKAKPGDPAYIPPGQDSITRKAPPSPFVPLMTLIGTSSSKPRRAFQWGYFIRYREPLMSARSRPSGLSIKTPGSLDCYGFPATARQRPPGLCDGEVRGGDKGGHDGEANHEGVRG